MSSKNIDLVLAGFFICLLFHTQLSFSYSLIGSQLTDLQTNDPVGFQSEANNWALSSLRNANTFSFCNGNYILGGYSVLGSTSGQYFERLYSVLPSHTEIQFSIKFWILDNWGSSDYFQLEFDNQLLTIWSLYMRTGAVDVCGDGYPDLPGVYIQGKIKHSATSLTLRVTSQLSLDTTLQSFGFRNIEINFLNTILPISYTNQLCTIAPISLPSSITTCSCSQTQYESPSHSGKCYQCNQNCATCTGGTSSSCTSCNPGRFLSGTECISCDASCGTCTGSGPSKCSTCASGYRLNTDDTGITCIAIKIIDDFSPSFLNAPIEAGTLTFLVLYPPLQYLRYLNITMSPRLGLLAQSQGRPILSLRFGFRMPEIWQESFIKYPLSPMLEKQDLHSSFFVNFWLELSSLLIILIAAFVFYAFEQSFKKFNKKFPERISSVLRIITAWNFCFILAATAIGNIIIFSAIEFSTFESSEDSLANFSLAFCIIVIIATIIFLFGTIIQVKRVVKEKIATQSVDSNNISAPNQDKHQGSQVLFSGFKRNTIFGTFFFVVYTFRLSFPIFLAACMEDAQLAQVILQVLINASIIACLLITKPLKSKINFVQLTLFELIVFIINILILALTISNDPSDNATESETHIGDVIIVGNFAINVLVIVFLAIKLFVGVKRILISSKEKSRQDKVIAYIHLLAIPMHQGGMGFEQVFANSLNDEVEDEQPKPKDTTLNSPVTVISRTFASIFSQKVINSKSTTIQKLPAVTARPQNQAPLQDISMSNSSILPMFDGSRSQLNTNRTLETERQETYIMEPNRLMKTLETEKFETMIENDRVSPIKMSDPDRLEPSIEPYSFMGKTRLYQIEEAEEMPSTSTVQNITEIQRPSRGKEQTDTDAYENMLQVELEKLYSDFLSTSMAENEKLPVSKAQTKPKMKKTKGSSSQRSLNSGSMKKVGSSSQITRGSKSQLSTHRALDSERGDKNSTQPTRPRSNKTLEASKSETEIYSGFAPQKEALSSLHRGYKEDLSHLENKSQNPKDADEGALQVEIDQLYSDFIATSSVEKPHTVRNHLTTHKSEKMGNEPIRRSKSNKGSEALRSQIDHIDDDIVTPKDSSRKKEELSNIDSYQDLQGNSKPQDYKDIDEKTLQLEIDQLYSEFLATSEAEKAHTVKSQNKLIQKRQISPRKDGSAPQSKHNTHRALESERNEIAIASTRRIPDKTFEIQNLEGTDYSFTTRKIPMHKIEETKEMPNSNPIQNDVESSRLSQIKGQSRIEIDDNALQLELDRLFADVLANTETTTKSKNKSEKTSSRNSRQRFVDRNKATPPKSERGIEEPSIIYKEEDYDYSEDQLFEMLGVSSQKKTNVREAPRRWKP